jgi:hypothetical protein
VPVDFAGSGRLDVLSGANTGGVVYFRGGEGDGDRDGG